MPELVVRINKGDEYRLEFSPGQSLQEILNTADIRIRTGCNGNGACGFCRMMVTKGEAGGPTQNERLLLDRDQLARGERLACQLAPRNSLEIEIVSNTIETNWRDLPILRSKQYSPLPGSYSIPLTGRSFGLVVDLGTTHISISLWNLDNGIQVAGRYGLNPQISIGFDIITRLSAAVESSDLAGDLSHQVIRSIGKGLADICFREYLDAQEVVKVVLVGNTAMLALMSGKNYNLLLKPEYWTQAIDCLPEEQDFSVSAWSINVLSDVIIIPPLAGFIGSDLIAGFVATKMIEHDPGILFIDFGTNSEIALWDGHDLWITSAAGGPAFEGCGINCGLPAEYGAAFSVHFNDASGEFAFEVVGGGKKPLGLCGSGLVDLLAYLVKKKIVTSKGLFSSSVPNKGFSFMLGKKKLVLTKRDIDMLQRAKAAIGVGVEVLMEKARMKYSDLQRIYIGGAFGQYLDISNACALGLLPPVPIDRCKTMGNTALAGGEDLLFMQDAQNYLNNIRSMIKTVELGKNPDFEHFFIKNLYIKPMELR
ncbi:MAG: DUF4445 domain-containing protein [Chloroflexi bacterium]|nr:DUF4445 domain-containing protein [Chloroflexota bacterium]